MSTIECKQINKLTGNRRRELYKWGVRTRQRVPEEISFLIYTLASSGRNRVNFLQSNLVGIKSTLLAFFKSDWNQIKSVFYAFFELDWNWIKSSLLLAFFDGNQISTFDMKQANFFWCQSNYYLLEAKIMWLEFNFQSAFLVTVTLFSNCLSHECQLLLGLLEYFTQPVCFVKNASNSNKNRNIYPGFSINVRHVSTQSIWHFLSFWLSD